MKRLLLSLAIGLGLIASAFAGNPYTAIGNANYSALPSDIRLVPTVAITPLTTRTITLPGAGITVVGSGTVVAGANVGSGLAQDRFEIVDFFGNIGGSNGCLAITAAAGDTLNGVSGGTVNLCNPFGRIALRPIGGIGWVVDSQEVQTSGTCPGTGTTVGSVSNVVGTWTASAPTLGVFTATAHGLTGACPIQISGGSQSTGVSTSTTYWVIPASITTNTFALASTPANALAGTALAITGSAGSGQTVTMGQAGYSTNTATNVTGVSIGPGEWDCRAQIFRNIQSGTSNFTMYSATMTTSGTAAAPTALTLASGQSDEKTTAAGVLTNATLASLGNVVGPWRLSTASATNVYVSVDDLFSAGTIAAFGNLTCRRAL